MLSEGDTTLFVLPLISDTSISLCLGTQEHTGQNEMLDKNSSKLIFLSFLCPLVKSTLTNLTILLQDNCALAASENSSSSVP